MHCAVPFFCARSGTEGEAAWRCGEWGVRSAGNASRSLRACVGVAWGSRSAREGRVAVRGRAKDFGGECFAQPAGAVRDCVGVRRGCVGERKCSARACAVRGRAKVFGGEWVVRAADLTHIRRSSTRARVLLYIRPPCPRREIAAMGPKDAFCEYPSSAKTSAPAPSTFALPRPRSHFPRIAFRGPRRAIGIPQQQLSTMGYPRKSYPHRCPPPCAKRSRPRACARVYIIYRSPVGRSRGVSAPLRKRVRAVVPPCPAPPCAGWGRAKAKADASSCSAEPCRLCAESLCAKAECTRQTPPLPVRSPRGNLSTAAPPPVDGRSAVRRVGEGKGKGGRPLAQQPAPAVRSPRPSLPTAAPPPPKWAPRLRRREGKRPNGAPPHHNAHTPNAARKRYLHNSRTKTQRRTKRCAQFVFFVFTPCKLLHNFSTVLHRSPREVPKRAQIAARRPDFPCFTARFPNVLLESHCAKHPRTAPVLPPKNALLRAYAKPRSHPRVRGTRQHATTCAFFTFSARYERIGGPLKTNFCPAEGRKWGRFWSQMLKNGLQTKKSTFSFGRLVI